MLDSLEGTNFSTEEVIADLNEYHIFSTDWSGVDRNELQNC